MYKVFCNENMRVRQWRNCSTASTCSVARIKGVSFRDQVHLDGGPSRGEVVALRVTASGASEENRRQAKAAGRLDGGIPHKISPNWYHVMNTMHFVARKSHNYCSSVPLPWSCCKNFNGIELEQLSRSLWYRITNIHVSNIISSWDITKANQITS